MVADLVLRKTKFGMSEGMVLVASATRWTCSSVADFGVMLA